MVGKSSLRKNQCQDIEFVTSKNTKGCSSSKSRRYELLTWVLFPMYVNQGHYEGIDNLVYSLFNFTIHLVSIEEIYARVLPIKFRKQRTGKEYLLKIPITIASKEENDLQYVVT